MDSRGIDEIDDGRRERGTVFPGGTVDGSGGARRDQRSSLSLEGHSRIGRAVGVSLFLVGVGGRDGQKLGSLGGIR